MRHILILHQLLVLHPATQINIPINVDINVSSLPMDKAKCIRVIIGGVVNHHVVVIRRDMPDIVVSVVVTVRIHRIMGLEPRHLMKIHDLWVEWDGGVC